MVPVNVEKMHRNIDSLSKTIQNYLERHSLHISNPPWKIRKSDLDGFGVFATRNIEVGELIFRDHPIILGPRTTTNCPIYCVTCYSKNQLKPCQRQCGLQLCSLQCQNSPKHQKECKVIRQWKTQPIDDKLSEKFVKVLSPIRALLLSDEDKNVIKSLKVYRTDRHGFEVDVMKNVLHLFIKEDEERFMRFVCEVMDANAYEVLVGDEETQSSVKALYSLGSLANHSCTPNTIHVFDNHQRMVVRAATFIPKGAEIFHSYSRCLWSTPTRRFHLSKTKNFLCKCQRCQDPTEFGSYMSSILCKSCKTGKVTPIDPLTHNEKWQCESCGGEMDKRAIAAISSVLGSTLNSYSSDDVEFMLKLLQKKLPSLVPDSHEIAVSLKYKLIWILGYRKDFTWTELSEELLETKEQFCRDLLRLLETLKLGECQMKGLLLYQLYLTSKERKKRQIKSGTSTKIQEKHFLLKAADILMYDVSAPAEIKKLWSDELEMAD